MTINPEWNNYDPSSMGWTKGQFEPFSYKGVSFPMGVNNHPGVATIFTHMLDALVPHIPGGLVSGQCWGGDTADAVHNSFHLYGLALDLNAPENPQTGNTHHYGSEYELPADTGTIIRPFGAEWGGDWTQNTPPDYMHVELQLTPADVTALAAQLIHGTVTPTPTQEWSPWQNVPPARRTVRQGDDGTDIESLQRVLNAWYPNLTALRVDGYDGPVTTGRVLYLQGRAGITVDGVVGRETWHTLGYAVEY